MFFFSSIYNVTFYFPIFLIRWFLFIVFFFSLKSAYYCKSFLPTIRGLAPRVTPGSVFLHPTVKLAHASFSTSLDFVAFQSSLQAANHLRASPVCLAPVIPHKRIFCFFSKISNGTRPRVRSSIFPIQRIRHTYSSSSLVSAFFAPKERIFLTSRCISL